MVARVDPLCNDWNAWNRCDFSVSNQSSGWPASQYSTVQYSTEHLQHPQDDWSRTINKCLAGRLPTSFITAASQDNTRHVTPSRGRAGALPWDWGWVRSPGSLSSSLFLPARVLGGPGVVMMTDLEPSLPFNNHSLCPEQISTIDQDRPDILRLADSSVITALTREDPPPTHLYTAREYIISHTIYLSLYTSIPYYILLYILLFLHQYIILLLYDLYFTLYSDQADCSTNFP